MKKTIISFVTTSLLLGLTAVKAEENSAFSTLKVPTSQLIIRTEQTIDTPDLSAFTNTLSTQANADMSYIRSLAVENSYVYKFPPFTKGVELKILMKKLAKVPGVVSVEEDVMLQPMAVNDPQFSKQWHYTESRGGINLEEAWKKSTGDKVTVAVIDTGIVFHEDLTANIIGGYDFISDTSVSNDGNGRDSNPSDPGDWIARNECYSGSGAYDSSWHGTHVAGTIAAVTNNKLGVAGIAYDAKIVPIRVLGKCGGLLSDITDAIIWASGGTVSGVPKNPYPADVINMSLGGNGSCSSTYQYAINQAVAKGATVVVAAGNENSNTSRFQPSSCSNVINVAATNRSGSRSYYSNYGNMVDVSAPGGETRSSTTDGVLSTLNKGEKSPGLDSYSYYQGTSMASPHVAGIVALMKSKNTSASPSAIEAALKNSARSLPGRCYGGCGAGIVDASAAIDAITGTSPVPEEPDDDSINETNLSATKDNWIIRKISIPSGTELLEVNISGGTGDADLYVRRGSEPTTSRYNCGPYLNGNIESCSISNPGAGDWYIGIKAYSDFSGVTLKASWK